MKGFFLFAAAGAMLAAVLVTGAGFSKSIAAETAAGASPAYYVCGCGPDCNCGSLSKSPGNCKCGKAMVQMHLLDIRDNNALFCTCGGDCACKMNPEDPSLCGCGKPVKTVALKGKYVCACGKDCSCGSISDTPGKCGCGQEMKRVE